MGKSASPPNPADAAVAGIKGDLQNQPFNYLINAASTLGQPITYNGKTYDFTGAGQADVAGKVSDQMAQTLLQLQTETSPTIIQQRIDELKAADPQGYAARKQLFDQIQQQANSSPGRPVSQDLQDQIQTELGKGVGFSDAKQAEQAREAVRGGQAQRGIYLGAAPTAQEAESVTQTGEALQSQRQQDALNLLQSGASPEDIAYRNMQQTLGNYGAFVAGQTPEAQFKQVSSTGAGGPVSLVGGAPNTNTFNPNAAQQGMNNALGIYQGQTMLNGQANPWLSGFSTAATAGGTLNRLGAFSANPYAGTGFTGAGANMLNEP